MSQVDQAPIVFEPMEKAPPFLKWRSSTLFITIAMAIGLMTDMALYGVIVPVIPFRLQQLGYNNIASLTGWLVAVYAGGLLISSPPVGYLGEKIKSRQLPLVGALLFMIGATILFMLGRKVWILLLARVLQGISGTIIWTLGLALICDSCEKEKVGLTIGQAMVGFSVGGLIGAPIGGALYDTSGYYAPFYFSIALIVLDIVLRLLIVEHRTAFRYMTPIGRVPESSPYVLKEKEEVKESDHLKAIWWMCKQPRALTSLYLSLGYGILFGGLLDGSMTIYLNYKYGYSSLEAGLVFIAAVAPSFVTSPLTGHYADKHGARKISIVVLCSGVPFIALLIIPQLPPAAFIVLLGLMGGILSATLVPVLADLTLLAAENPSLGTPHVFSGFNAAFSLGSLIGPIMAGQILEAAGPQKGWQIMAGICTGMFLFALPLVCMYMGGNEKKKMAMIASKEREEAVA